MVLRAVFRVLTYPALFYVILVYYHAKSKDPDGFTAFKIAFNIPDFSFHLPAIDTKTFPPSAEGNDNTNVSDKMDDLHYPTPTPKAKVMKSSFNPVCQDLLEQRQLLYDLATSCRLLETRQSETTPSKCFIDFPYYERPLNQNLFQNARIYSALFESTLNRIKTLEDNLKSTALLDTFYDELINFVKDCGPVCIPLARIFYNQPELSESELLAVTNDYKARIEALNQVLQARLLQSQTNILSSSKSILYHNFNNITVNYDDIQLHKAALIQLNDHFDHLKGEKVITPDRIDQNSLQHFIEYAKNMKM